LLLYNDSWSQIPGDKHPWALSRPAREVWPEIWDTIGPLFSHVMATGATPLGYLGPEHAQALDLCRAPVSVAEVAAQLKLPAVVTKVLLSDLVDCGALTTKPPQFHHNPTDRSLLEAVLDGLRRQL